MIHLNPVGYDSSGNRVILTQVFYSNPVCVNVSSNKKTIKKSNPRKRASRPRNKKDKTGRVIEVGRRTRGEIVKWNPMTARVFQAGHCGSTSSKNQVIQTELFIETQCWGRFFRDTGHSSPIVVQ